MNPEEEDDFDNGEDLPRGITLDEVAIIGDPNGDDSELREAERAERARSRGFDTVEDVVASRVRKGNAARFDDSGPAARRREMVETLTPSMDTVDRAARSVPVVGDTLGDWLDSGTAGATGATEGATMGFSDELGGAAAAGNALLEGEDAGEAYDETRDRMRALQERDRAASPTAYGFGTLAGGLATAPLLPGVAAGRGAPLVTRLGAAALEGAGYGGLAGAGFSDEESAEGIADDAAHGALFGMGAGAIGGAAGEGLAAGARSARAAAPAARTTADRARVASVIGTGNNPLSARAERDVANLPALEEALAAWEARGRTGPRPDGFGRAAELIRREGIGSTAGTVEGAAARAAAATERTGGRIGEFTRELDAAMPEGVPVETFTEALGGVADDMATDPYTRDLIPRIERTADDWRGAAEAGARTDRMGSPRAAGPLPEGAGERITGPRAREAMGSLRSRVDFVSGAEGPAAAGADLDAYRALRGSYDDAAEAALGARGRDYRPLRNDHATASTIERYARDAAARSRRAPGPGLRGMMGGVAASAAGAGPVGTALAAEGVGAIARRRPALEATGREAIASILESSPRLLGDYAAPLLRAARRGGEVLAGAHAALMRNDPEYRRKVEAALAAPPEAAEPRTLADFLARARSAEPGTAPETASAPAEAPATTTTDRRSLRERLREARGE